MAEAAMAERGKYYWGVKVPDTLSDSREILLHADEVLVTDGGTLAFILNAVEGSPRQVTLALAPGQWFAYFAASVLDGHACGVEHWPIETE